MFPPNLTPSTNSSLCVFQLFLLSPIPFSSCKNAQILPHLKPSLATLLPAQCTCPFHYQSPERTSGVTGPRPPSHTHSFLRSWHGGGYSHGHAGSTPSSLIPYVLMTIQAPLVGPHPPGRHAWLDLSRFGVHDALSVLALSSFLPGCCFSLSFPLSLSPPAF